MPRNRNPRSRGRSSRFAGTEEAISCWRSFMRRDVIGTLRILNLIPLRLLGPVLPAKASAVQFFIFVGFLETFRIPSFYFLIPNSDFRHAPRSTPYPVTPPASSMLSLLRVESSRRLNSLTSLMLQFSLSLVRSLVVAFSSLPFAPATFSYSAFGVRCFSASSCGPLSVVRSPVPGTLFALCSSFFALCPLPFSLRSSPCRTVLSRRSLGVDGSLVRRRISVFLFAYMNDELQSRTEPRTSLPLTTPRTLSLPWLTMPTSITFRC